MTAEEKSKRKARLYSSRWYYANKGRALATAKAWTLRNKLRVRRNLKLWASKNRAYLKAYKEIWRSENAHKMRSARRKWTLRNPEKDKLSKRKWQTKNRIYHNTYGRFWRKENPGKCSDYAHRRRSRLLGGTVGLKGIPELYEFFRNCVRIQCFYCQSWVFGKNVHVDHKVPISRGGLHAVENLCASCPKCNLTKSDKLLSEWRPELVDKI